MDRYLEKDPQTRFAVEVMVKDNIVTLGGEVASQTDFTDDALTGFVRQAVNEIGYTREYQEKRGRRTPSAVTRWKSILCLASRAMT